jgi:hypothetical protein
MAVGLGHIECTKIRKNQPESKYFCRVSLKVALNAPDEEYIHSGIIAQSWRHPAVNAGRFGLELVLLATQNYFAGFDEESKREIMRKVTEL